MTPIHRTKRSVIVNKRFTLLVSANPHLPDGHDDLLEFVAQLVGQTDLEPAGGRRTAAKSTPT